MRNTYPAVLIISHTCFSSNDSMGSTLASYFSEYDSDSVAQFYIKDMIPNLEVCGRYFSITDHDVLQKFLKPWIGNIGRSVSLDKCASVEKRTAPSDRHASGNRALKMLFRDFLWSLGAWNNKKLHQWIAEFQPDLILCQPGDFPYLLTLTCKLAEKYHLPVLIHQSETYYLKPMQATDLPYKLFRRSYKKAYEKLMAHTSAAVYLCDAIKRDYDRVFQVPSYCILRSTDIVPHHKKLHDAADYTFLYAGNVGEKVGRDRPLVEIGQTLKTLGYYLDVYTSCTGKHMSDFTEENGIRLHPAVPYEELRGIIESSDFIIHTESRREQNIIDLQYAFTTKTADMLASGCCPIVYGSPRIASIRYFKDTGTACVIEEKAKLYDKIKELIENRQLTERYIDRALEQAKEFHSPEKNSKRFAAIIEQVCNP